MSQIEPITNEKNNEMKEIDNSELKKLNEELINEFKSFSQEIKDSEMDDEKIKNLTNDIENYIESFKNFIPSLDSSSNEEKSEIKSGIIGKINHAIDLLDKFFKKDLKDINIILNDFNEIEKGIKESIKSNEEHIKKLKLEFINKIKLSLLKNKEELQEKLKSKSYSVILVEINEELLSNLKGINLPISEYINSIEKQNEKLEAFEKKIFEGSLKDKKNQNFNKNQSFNDYISNILGNKDEKIGVELYKELVNTCEAPNNILSKKGFTNWISSLLSNQNYLENIIDLLIDNSSNKINYIFLLIQKESDTYLMKYLKKINSSAKFDILKSNDEQKNKWKKLCDSYEQKRNKINQIKNEFI